MDLHWVTLQKLNYAILTTLHFENWELDEARNAILFVLKEHTCLVLV